MGFMEIMMKKIRMNQIKAAGISFNSVSCEAIFTGDRKLKTTEPTQKNPTSLTVRVAYKVVASQKPSSSSSATADPAEPFLPPAEEVPKLPTDMTHYLSLIHI